MSVDHQNGFDHYGDNIALMLQDGWVEIGDDTSLSAPSVGANTGPMALRIGPSAFIGARLGLTATYSDLIVSFWSFVDRLPAVDNLTRLFNFRTDVNGSLARVGLQSDGKIRFTNAFGNGPTTPNPVIVPGKWQHVAVRLSIGVGAIDTVELRIDGEVIFIGNSLDFGDVNIGQLSFSHAGTTGLTTVYVDDLVVNGTTGTYNLDFPGKARVATLRVVADEALSEWTPNTRAKFGAAYMQYSGSGAFSVPPSVGLDLGTGDFTIETFAKFVATPVSNFHTVVGRWREATEARVFRLVLGSSAFNGGALAFQKSVSGSPVTVVSEVFAPLPEKWYHLCVQRNSGSVRLFIDGVLVDGPVADSADYAGMGTLLISGNQQEGASSIWGAIGMTGLVDEMRITKGLARYATGGFTLPSAPHPRTVSGDPDINKVSLLVGFDDSVADESIYRHMITLHGDAARVVNDDAPPGEYKTINQIPPRDDTGIEAANVNDDSEFLLERLPASATRVIAAQIKVRARKPDGGAGSIVSALVRDSGEAASGGTKALAQSYAYYSDIIEEDPLAGDQQLTTRSFIRMRYRVSRTA